MKKIMFTKKQIITYLAIAALVLSLLIFIVSMVGCDNISAFYGMPNKIDINATHSPTSPGSTDEPQVTEGLDTEEPTEIPTEVPSTTPTPTQSPTKEPTEVPTATPTEEPTEKPTEEPVKGEIDKAINELQTEFNKIEKTINDSRLSSNDKNVFIPRLQKALKDAKADINNAKTVADVANAKSKGLKALNDVLDETKVKLDEKEFESTKAVAITALDKKYADVSKEIKALKLESEGALLADLDEVLKTAKADVNKAKTSAEVLKAQNEGLELMGYVLDLANAKVKALNDIQTEYDKVKKEIEDMKLEPSNTTQLLTELENVQKASRSNINNAETSDEVAKAKKDGMDELNKVRKKAQDAKQEMETIQP